MKKILVVIDMQNDFIDGPLGTPEARAIVDNVCEKIRGEEWDYVYYTHDTHFDDYLERQEGKKLPVKHCHVNDSGWDINPKIHKAVLSIDYDKRERIVKSTFGSVDLAHGIGYLVKCFDIEKQADVELTLVGVCTDICVISNALLLKAHYPEMKIVVDASCCAGSSPEKHFMALDVMKSCQVDVVNDDYETIRKRIIEMVNATFGVPKDLLESED